MLERLNRYLEGSEKGVYVFLIWSFIGAVIGAVVGVVGITFHILLEEVTAFRMSHPWILFLLPLGGLVIAGLYHLLRMQNDRGTNLILIAVRVNEKVSLRLTPLIFISTIITHLLGGSAGREGAALQIGGSIGSFIGRKIKLDEKDERIITIEDNAELRILDIPNLVTLEARCANLEGTGEITIRELIRTALRMRPNRIVCITGAFPSISLIYQRFLGRVYSTR